MKVVRRDERGSMPITLAVMFVATALIVATVVAIENGMRVSRRSGDSANALQLADAAVNDAVKQVAAQVGNSIPLTTQSLGSAGSYTYSATLDPAASVWHIEATGTDPTGVKRRVKADAVNEPLFGNAWFVQAGAQIPAGTALDSFIDGTTPQRRCTRKGFLGTNDAQNLSFGNNGAGTGTRNCTQSAYGISWPYPVDGCVSWADQDPRDPPTGNGKCPPTATRKDTPKYPIPTVNAPSDLTLNSNPPTCDASNPIRGGQRVLWSSVKLRSGCYVQVKDPMTGAFLGPVTIFTTGLVEIGDPNGNSGEVNGPIANDSAICPTTNPTSRSLENIYCPGWSGNLQIYLTSGASGPVKWGNSVKFWGVVLAPTQTLEGFNGSPQVDVWGAVVAASASPAAQFEVHYDEALGNLTSGRYSVRNWREEPIS